MHAHASRSLFKTKLIYSLASRPKLLKNLKVRRRRIESSDRGATPAQAAAAREVAEKLGVKIHAVLFGWANFNQEKSVEKDIEAVSVALRAAQAYGADAVLLVPCRTGVTPIPDPWDFDIEFDPKTNHVKRVVTGDNAKYAKYIEAHNQAADMSRAAVKKRSRGGKGQGRHCVENVEQLLWVKPAIANFVKSSDSPW